MAATELVRLVHAVSDVVIGESTRFADGRLTVGLSDVRAAFAAPALASVAAHVVRPGESARIVKVLDAVEPRSKGPGGAGVFPGFLAPAGSPAGVGETHVLRGVAVVTAGFLPRAQEALVDLSGPAAPLSVLGSTIDLVVEFAPTPQAPWEEVADALRWGALRLAARLAEAALGAPPDAVEVLRPTTARAAPDRRGDLPRIGTVTHLQTQGAFKDVFVRGTSFATSPPSPVEANELEDGIVVSAQYGHPGLKNPTYLFQNHPVVRTLRARDGVDLEFAGLVLAPEPVEQARKEETALATARLCRDLGWDAAIVTKEGGGNADSDLSLAMDALEEAGIVAVGTFGELAGADGTGPPLVAPPARATAMVSSGNYDERLHLPAVETALGGERLDLADAPATAAVEVPTAAIYASLSPIGWGRLTCTAGPIADDWAGQPGDPARAPADRPTRV
jgi:sarcosine reductase